MGSSVPSNDEGGFDELPDAQPMEDPMGEPESDKPFNDEPFDAGVEANEEDSPEKYIQQLSGKLGQSLRKYTEDLGAPDYDLEKFAINSVLSATNSGEMDQQDQADIIQKVKSSTTDGTGKKNDEPAEADVEGGEELPSDEPLDLDNIDMEESVLEKKSTDDLLNKKVYVTNRKEMGIVKKIDGNDVIVQMPKTKEMINVTLADVKEITEHNPNGNGNTVFQDAFLGVDDEGMEENKYITLESDENDSMLNQRIKEMVKETFMTTDVQPVVKPQIKPVVEPKRSTRRSKPWTIIPEQLPDPKPKAEGGVQFINNSEFSEDGNLVSLVFDVDGVRFNGVNFINTGEVVEKPLAYDEPYVFAYQTDILDNGKQYLINVSKFGNPENFDAPVFTDGDKPEIEEV